MRPVSTINRRRNRARERRGLAVTELAICLPLLVVLVLGSIESCNMIFLRHSLSIASYEAVRTAIRINQTADDAEAEAEELLEGRGIVGAKVKIFPPNLSTLVAGDHIRVQVTAPADLNRVVAPWFFWGQTIESEAVMAKE